MIVTLTANPALDRTVILTGPLEVGEVQVAADVREDAAGKGVNVARVMAGAGIPALAVLPLAHDDPYAVALHATGLAARTVDVAGAVRTNLTLVDPEGRTTKVNLAGATLSDAEVEALITATVDAAADASWLVLAGSVPPGAGDDFYVRVIGAVRARFGAASPRIAVDASGAPLAAVMEASRPDLIKPNDDELAELVGVPGERVADAAGAAAVAAALVPARAGAALVTLGSRGAVLVTADAAYAATPPPITVRNTVGAGDSSLAGYLVAAAAGLSPTDRLASAIRYGAAAAASPGTQPPTPSDLPAGDIPVHLI